MIFCFHFFLFLLIPFLYLIHVAGCDDLMTRPMEEMG